MERYLPDALRLSTQVLKLGNDHTVSFAGTSQFTAQGVSACGLAAFNFARIGFRIEHGKKYLADMVNELGTREVIEEIVAICAGWSSDVHLEVEEIHKLPIFTKYLKLASVEYCPPRPKHFEHILENMNKIERSAVTIITRPPEIIGCFKFATGTDRPLFVVFDSHPRPSHPHGAGLSFSTSIYSTARILSDILPTMDANILDSADFQWQAQLLANCSAHIYVARKLRHDDHEDVVVQSSLTLLTLRAQIAEFKRENETLSSANGHLESVVDRLRTSVQQEQMKRKEETPSFLTTISNRVIGRSYGLISHAVPGSSRTFGSSIDCAQSSGGCNQSLGSPSEKQVPARSFSVPGPGGAQSIFADNPPPVPSKAPPNYDDLDLESTSSLDWDDLCIQTVVARKLQNEFDSEDNQLRQEQADLAKHIQPTFQCCICMDDLPEDDVARVDDCVHTTCRYCLREFVSSKIQEHRYPIFCPMCTITSEGNLAPSEISRFLIEQLGISEEQSLILTEMELAAFSVQIHCRRCQRPAFVDRQDFLEATNIACPQRGCRHVWCKKCEQTIVIGGPTHSCDGLSELNHLMEEKGWKHCPNCATPIQKESGCNHMACISPGCNSHFCYICGGMIVQSALNNEINQAVSAHFRKCQLFEVPE